MGASRKHYDVRLTPGAWKHIEAPGCVSQHSYVSLTQQAQQQAMVDQQAQQLQRAQQARQQNMAVGQWFDSTGTSGGTSTTTWAGVGGVSVTPEEARISSYWNNEYDLSQDKYTNKLLTLKVNERLMELEKTNPPHLYTMENDKKAFDRYFGHGAWLQYFAPKKAKTKQTRWRAAKKESRLVPWYVRPFVVADGETVLQELEKGRSIAMSTASKKFYVGNNETLLEALQREFDVWTTGISIRVAKPGEFTMQGGGITFG